MKKEEREITILYTPLIHCELAHIKRDLGLTGIKIKDVEADICSIKCKDPKRTYAEWRDMKDPKEKIEIANFIFQNSIPKVEKSEKEKEVFQMLQGLV